MYIKKKFNIAPTPLFTGISKETYKFSFVPIVSRCQILSVEKKKETFNIMCTASNVKLKYKTFLARN